MAVLVMQVSAQSPGQAPAPPPSNPAGGNNPVPPAGAAPPANAGRPKTAETPAPGFVRPQSYPERPPADPAAVARGKAVFGVNCAFCHGSDARGGEGGPNLIRSELVLNDRNGEKIAVVVQNGRLDKGMPKFDLSNATISDIAAYIHNFKVGGYDISRQKPPSILVGNATAGHAYFDAKCASCHSNSGDLKGIASKITDPRALQQAWLMPGGGGGRRGPEGSPLNLQPTTATVTLSSGQTVEGKLDRIDDFVVTVTATDGKEQSFRRDGDSPKIEIHDPLKPHRDLLPSYTDKDIHNLTAYLETLK